MSSLFSKRPCLTKKGKGAIEERPLASVCTCTTLSSVYAHTHTTLLLLSMVKKKIILTYIEHFAWNLLSLLGRRSWSGLSWACSVWIIWTHVKWCTFFSCFTPAESEAVRLVPAACLNKCFQASLYFCGIWEAALSGFPHGSIPSSLEPAVLRVEWPRCSWEPHLLRLLCFLTFLWLMLGEFSLVELS